MIDFKASPYTFDEDTRPGLPVDNLRQATGGCNGQGKAMTQEPSCIFGLPSCWSWPLSSLPPPCPGGRQAGGIVCLVHPSPVPPLIYCSFVEKTESIIRETAWMCLLKRYLQLMWQESFIRPDCTKRVPSNLALFMHSLGFPGMGGGNRAAYGHDNTCNACFLWLKSSIFS